MSDSLSHDATTDGAKADEVPQEGKRDFGAGSLVIRGTVRDSLGVALPRAVITLTLVGGRQLEKTRSGMDGGFQVVAPSHGDYLLAAFSHQLGEQSITVRLEGRPVEVEFRIAVPRAVAD